MTPEWRKLAAGSSKRRAGFITEVNGYGYAGWAAAYNEGEPWRRALMDYLTGNRERMRGEGFKGWAGLAGRCLWR